TITSDTPGATIRYTTDGSTPTPSHGTVYTGPVLMERAYVTDITGYVTNASGVTMLKAVAYRSGMPESDVFTGNYIVIYPLRYELRPSLVLGLAHMAYNVSPENWSSVLDLWTNYLGYDTVVLSDTLALIKINDQQYIELYQNPVVAPRYQLSNYGFYVSDCESFRLQLDSAGIQVPESCTLNTWGNLSFSTADPDGHDIEWLQYLPEGTTGQSLGQHMPGTQLFGYMQDYGLAVLDVDIADNYYVLADFRSNGTKVYLPNSNCYLEMLTYRRASQQVIGNHQKAQLITFRGMDVLTAGDILQARDASIAQVRGTEG